MNKLATLNELKTVYSYKDAILLNDMLSLKNDIENHYMDKAE